jgi:hypothetical protein
MEEGDKLVTRSLEGNLVDELGALIFRLGELAVDVVSGKGDVVDAAGGEFFEEFGDRTVIRSRLEQLDMDFSNGEKRGADFLGFDFLAAFAFESENVFVVWNGFVERSDGNAKVVDFRDHCVACGGVLKEGSQLQAV